MDEGKMKEAKDEWMDDKNCIYSAVLEEGTCGGPRGKLFAVQSFEKEETARIKTILNAKGVKFVSFPFLLRELFALLFL